MIIRRYAFWIVDVEIFGKFNKALIMNKYSQLVVDTFVRVKSHVLFQNTIKTTNTVQTSQIEKNQTCIIISAYLIKTRLIYPRYTILYKRSICIAYV